MTRITDKDLQNIVNRINRMTDSPSEGWTKGPETASGHVYTSNVGNYHLDHAYGGVALYRMANTAGGCSDVLNCGHVSKKELQGLMFAYIQGIYTGQEMQAKVPA
jgi:hypothetical protein